MATRIEVTQPTVGRAALSRAIRATRIRQTASIIAWVAVMLLIAVVVVVGSRPPAIGL